MNEFSLKEAKGTFLTPAKMTLMHFFIINHLVRPIETCMQNCKFLVRKNSGLKLAAFVNSGSIVEEGPAGEAYHLQEDQGGPQDT